MYDRHISGSRDNRSDRSDRNDRGVRSERREQTERPGGFDRSDRIERSDRRDRGDRMERDRIERNDQNNRNDQNRNDRSDRNRNDRGDRNRNDRSGDGDYYSRYQGKRFGGGYKDMSSAYRRGEGSDYYSFQGPGGAPRRRQAGAYDSYQGSKYRPGKRGEPGWRREKDFARRPEARGDGSLLDERRSTSRKYERDPYNKSQGYRAPYSQAKPERNLKRERDPRREAHLQGRDLEGRDLEGRDLEGRDSERRDPERRDSERRDSEKRDSERRDLERHKDSRKEGPKSSYTESAPHADFDSFEAMKPRAPKARSFDLATSDSKDFVNSRAHDGGEIRQGREARDFQHARGRSVETNPNDQKKASPPELRQVRDAFREKAEHTKSSIEPHEKRENAQKFPEKKDLDKNWQRSHPDGKDYMNRPSSPAQKLTSRKSGDESDSFCTVADSSVLSPIGNTTTDDFIRNMDIPQDMKSIHDDHSDAETEVNEAPYSMEVSKAFLRKEGPDPERRRIKRNIVISDNEADDEPEGKDDDEPSKSAEHGDIHPETEQRVSSLGREASKSVETGPHSEIPHSEVDPHSEVNSHLKVGPKLEESDPKLDGIGSEHAGDSEHENADPSHISDPKTPSPDPKVQIPDRNQSSDQKNADPKLQRADRDRSSEPEQNSNSKLQSFDPDPNSDPEEPNPEFNADEDARSGSDTDNRPSPDKKPDPTKGYKIKRDSTGRSQLQRACKKGQLSEVQELIQRGASPNESDFGGFTCLHEAALAGHTEIVKVLIANGADVNKQAFEVGDYETPLMDAAENKHTSTVSVLLENGADPNICNIDGYSTLTKLLHLNKEDNEYEEILEMLTDLSPLQMPQGGQVVEDPAESYFSDLIKKKANPVIYKYAAQGLKESAAENFIANAFSLSKMPDILNLAARNGHVELVDILLGLNPGPFDINQKNKIGVNALLASVGRGVYDVTRFLLSKGADATVIRDQDGMRPVDIAKSSSSYDPREVLLLEQSQGTGAPSRRQGTSAHDGSLDPNQKNVDMASDENSALSTGGGDSKGEPEGKPSADLAAPGKKRPVSSHSGPSAKRRDLHDGSQKPESTTDAAHTEKRSAEEKSEAKVNEKVERVKAETPEESAAAAALHKAQEEQRLKAAEDAKVWQEKVQAKKKARKEMFLQAEKEKERRRKEEEQRRIQQLKQQQIDEQKQRAKAAEEARIAAAEVQAKKHALEMECIFNEYPIGLREFALGVDGSTRKDPLAYSPLYVFDVAGRSCVVDLQACLLAARPVSDMGLVSGCIGGELCDEAKIKLWALFFDMVGVSRNGAVEKNGLAKFCKLQLRYVDLDAVAHYFRECHPQVYEKIWGGGLVARVDMASKDTKAMVGGVGSKSESSIGFIPPKFQRRGDILRTVQAANTPLW